MHISDLCKFYENFCTCESNLYIYPIIYTNILLSKKFVRVLLVKGIQKNNFSLNKCIKWINSA